MAAYSVVHGKDGEPEWGVVICDVPEGDRAYGKVVDADMLASIERDELVGRKVHPDTDRGGDGSGKADDERGDAVTTPVTRRR